MKCWVTALFALVCCVSATAQQSQPAGEAQKASMLEKIGRAAAALKTMQCDFEQTKYLSLLDDKLVSKGRMYYKQTDLLRWEYTTPYPYVFLLNGTKVMLESAGRKDVIDVKSSRLFQEIARIMMNSVTGKCLADDRDFLVTLSLRGEEWIAALVPWKKEMKQMFAAVTLHFDPHLSMVSEIELTEKSGDLTRIVLKNVQVNTAVDEKVFVVD